MAAEIVAPHIEVEAAVAVGQPRIAGRRITVRDVALWHEYLGRSADEIAAEYDVTLAQVYAALAYYFDHRLELDRSLAERDALVEALRQQTPSRLRLSAQGRG